MRLNIIVAFFVWKVGLCFVLGEPTALGLQRSRKLHGISVLVNIETSVRTDACQFSVCCCTVLTIKLVSVT